MNGQLYGGQQYGRSADSSPRIRCLVHGVLWGGRPLAGALHRGPSSFLVAIREKEGVVLETWGRAALSAGVAASNVKSTIFQDRKLPFCCFRSKKDRMETFLNQNSGSKQNVFYQFSKFLDQKLLFCSVSKNILNYLNVLFWFLSSLKQTKTFRTSKKILK